MLLTHSLATNAERYPDKPVVIHQARHMSYAELDRLSDLLAQKLLANGVVKGDRVGLYMENSCEYVAAYFAGLKSGAAVVPLNVQMTAREVSFLIGDFTPKAVLTDKKFLKILGPILAAAAQPFLVVTVDLAELPAEPQGTHSFPELSRDDLASIIYTSGTTGKPKGVMLSHGNLAANVLSIIEYLRLSSDDTVMVILPFYYSYGASLLTTHVHIGGTLVIDNRFLYPNVVLESMAREGVTGFAGVPSHFALLLRSSGLRDCKFPKLRYVTQAGGAMSPALIREFLGVLPEVRFYVMYGQTEATARLSYLDPDFLLSKTGSIGKAIPGVELDVLDENGAKVKPGETGEIVARGKNIMQGYWNSPEETALVLKENGLHTGDLARVDEDGFIYIVSRKKDMIKSGANRISPREIEDVVCQLGGVLESAAVGVPDEILGEAIQLFVVPAEGAALEENGVALFCKKNLAPYKVPKQVTFIPALPKTASGKVKREELKKSFQPSVISPQPETDDQ